MASVTLDKVTKRYGETTIVRDVDLKVQDKEFLVLVGPSGSGKSTTLRMVAGLEEITSGSIFIGDQRVNDVPPKDRDIAMVFQSYALYPHMTVFDNMAFGLSLRGVPRKEIQRRVNEAAAILGLEGLLDRKPGQLSGGQRQRVALGRAIVREPKVFLMDEPLSNLDAKLRVQTRAELVKLQERLETTVMYVTHDQVEAMTMGHRIAVMNDARLQQVDTPQSIYEHPVNMFVAAFIGSPAMNFVRGRLVGTAESMRVETADFALDVPAARTASLQHLLGQEVILGIRPEHVTYQGPDVDGQQAVLRPRIEVVETLGHEAIVHLTIGATPLVARTPYERGLHAGMVLPFVVDMQRFHLFDPETERALT